MPFLWRYFSLNFEFAEALLRLAVAIDDIHRHLYAFTTKWRHLVMLNVSIGGSREGKRGALLEKSKPPFSAYLHPPMLSMHLPYCYHREGPHTLYYNHRHAILFLSLSLSIIKMHPKFSSLTPPMILGILKPEYMWKLYWSRSLKQNFMKIGLEIKKL